MLWLKEYSRQSNNRLVLCRSACSNRPVPGCAVRSTFSLRAKDELTFSFEGNTLEQHSSVEAAFQDKYATSYCLVPIVRNDHSVGNFTIHICVPPSCRWVDDVIRKKEVLMQTLKLEDPFVRSRLQPPGEGTKQREYVPRPQYHY